MRVLAVRSSVNFQNNYHRLPSYWTQLLRTKTKFIGSSHDLDCSGESPTRSGIATNRDCHIHSRIWASVRTRPGKKVSSLERVCPPFECKRAFHSKINVHVLAHEKIIHAAIFIFLMTDEMHVFVLWTDAHALGLTEWPLCRPFRFVGPFKIRHGDEKCVSKMPDRQRENEAIR